MMGLVPSEKEAGELRVQTHKKSAVYSLEEGPHPNPAAPAPWSWTFRLPDKNRRRPRVIKAWVGTSILPKGEGATRTPSRCPTAKRQVNICVPLTPSLADWLTLVAPSAVFEGDRIDLTCQKKNGWKVKRVSYYKDGEELPLSSEVSNFSIQRAVLSDSGTYHCAVAPVWPLFPFQKEKTSRSVRIEVQGTVFPPAGQGLDQSGAGPGRGT